MTIDWLELTGVVLTLVSIWLATRENIWYYPTGVVSLLIYTWLFFQAKLYAEALLQLAFLALMIYGWYEWLHGGEQKSALPVSRAPRRAWGWGVAAGLVISAMAVAVQLEYTDNPAPYVDSSIFAWSLVAQWMTARKWLGSWIVWIAVNTVAVPLYISRGLELTAGLYAGLWMLAFVGYVQWRRSLASA